MGRTIGCVPDVPRPTDIPLYAHVRARKRLIQSPGTSGTLPGGLKQR
jgi:hypothetical protein